LAYVVLIHCRLSQLSDPVQPRQQVIRRCRHIFILPNSARPPPQILSQTVPEYSEQARAAGIQGEVVPQCDIDKNGHSLNVAVVKTLDEGLDKNAVNAVRHWQFSPARRDGRPVVWRRMMISVPFALPNESPKTETLNIPLWVGIVIGVGVIVAIALLLVMGRGASDDDRKGSHEAGIVEAALTLHHDISYPAASQSSNPVATSEPPIQYQEPHFVSALSIPSADALPPNADWENRFQVRSGTSSNRTYVVEQHKTKRHWACSCKGWQHYRRCKHLSALSLPHYERPHEVDFEVIDVAKAQHAKCFPPELSDFPDVDLSSAVPPRFVVVDLETTGFDVRTQEIIEIGAIRVQTNSNLADTFHALVKPRNRIPDFITQKTRISQDIVDQSGKPLGEAITEFAEFAGNLPLITYNAAFDMRFLRHAGLRHNVAFTNRTLCALKLARRAWPSLPCHTLEYLSTAAKFNDNFSCTSSDEGAHRAIGDCKRTVFVYIIAAAQLGYRNSEIGSRMTADDRMSGTEC
jgi:DNA polymerase-3 subunit epsilon